MTPPDPMRLLRDLEPTATITRSGPLLRYHIAYTDGIFHLEQGHFALTRRAAEHKAQRTLRKLKRDRARRAEALKL